MSLEQKSELQAANFVLVYPALPKKDEPVLFNPYGPLPMLSISECNYVGETNAKNMLMTGFGPGHLGIFIGKQTTNTHPDLLLQEYNQDLKILATLNLYTAGESTIRPSSIELYKKHINYSLVISIKNHGLNLKKQFKIQTL